MTGAEYIAEFLSRVGSDKVFALTGGACAFMIDAVGQHPELEYICFQHEQSAAMAADAVWRVSGRVGVTMATSGPGATNLITGIACSYFDSRPSLHITGQVNMRESASLLGANVRQAGFQETKIVDMVRPITKYAVMVRSGTELKRELAKAYSIATSGRMGPVLIDVPMDVQQAAIEGDIVLPEPVVPATAPADLARRLTDFLGDARRPTVLVGFGVGAAGVQACVASWLDRTQLPFVSSWGGLGYVDHDLPGYCGQIGVYGNRGANFIVQNCDRLLVLGSRLDNRQRSGNPANFARGARVHVLDVDPEELRKLGNGQYSGNCVDLARLPAVLDQVDAPPLEPEWRSYVESMKESYLNRETSSSAQRLNSLSPYEVIRWFNAEMAEDAVVIGDTGACVCWLHQVFRRKRHEIFTAGGNSPMGYALPAAIGAKLSAPERQVVVFIGDGGFQLCLHELQSLSQHGAEVTIVVMNNSGYGIIKQFQDSYLSSRYHGSAIGYSNPDFELIAAAYGLRYRRVEHLDDLEPALLDQGSIIIEVLLNPNTLIEPKLEMGRPINDQFPYLPEDEYRAGNRFVPYPR